MKTKEFLLELSKACERADEVERFNPSLPIGRAGISILSTVLSGGNPMGREMNFKQAAKFCLDLAQSEDSNE